MSRKKVIEIDEQELAALVRGCDFARKIIAAVVAALGKIDDRLKATRFYLDRLETEVRYAEEVEDD